MFAQLEFDCTLFDAPGANPSILHSVAFGFDRFVAVGEPGTVMMSTNGIQWSEQTVPTDLPLFGVTYGAGQFVAVGNFGCVLVSQDGITWDRADAGETNHLHKIVFGNGTFVALNDAGRTLYVSPNGRDWEVTTNSFGQAYDLFFGGGKFVAVGMSPLLLDSSDGRLWTSRSAGAGLTGASANGLYYLAAPGSFGPPLIGTSTDLVNWNWTTTVGVSGWLNSLLFDEGRFVGLNAYGFIQWSSDLTTWQNATGSPVSSFLAITSGMGMYVAVGGYGSIAVSTNAANWTLVAGVCQFTKTAQGNGTTVGINGGNVYSSTNASHFIQRMTNTNYVKSIAFSDGVFVAGGFSALMQSNDGIDWQPAKTQFRDIFWLAHYRHLFVGLSYGLIITSEDGSNWTLRLGNPGGVLYSLFEGENRWIAYGNGTLFSSPDLLVWQNLNAYVGSADLGPVNYENGAYSIKAAGGSLRIEALVSADGVKWFDPFKAGPVLSMRPSPAAGELRASVAGGWGQIYQLESTGDFVDWVPLGKTTNTAGIATVVITSSGDVAPLFIRAVSSQ